MKRLLFVFSFILLLPVISFAEGKTLSVKIDGMTCPSCAASVEKEVIKIKGVESVEINLGSHTATLKVKEGKQIDEAILKKAVKDAGFKVEYISSQS